MPVGNARPTPKGVAEEGMESRKNGRPTVKPPMDSILRVLKGIEDSTMALGEFDPSYSRKLLAAYSCIALERALLAPEKDIALKTRADIALRTAPVIAMLETLIPKDQGKRLPSTEAAVDSEIANKLGTLNRLLAKQADLPVDVILDTLAPAAAEPPKEA